MGIALSKIQDTIEAMRTRQTYDSDIDVVQELTLRCIWWIAHAESGLGRTPLDERDYKRAARILAEELDSEDPDLTPADLRLLNIWSI